jgi:hypothetical protein
MVSIKASGFALIINNWQHPVTTVNLDISKARYNTFYNDYSFDVKTAIDSISHKFNNTITVLKVNPETITFKVKPRVYKTVPVKLNALISYANQYQLNGNITIEPSMIRISGDSAELNQINEIETESVLLRNLNKSVTQKVKLKTNFDHTSVKLDKQWIELKIPVEKFTEAVLSIPVAVDNVPRGFSIKTFPTEVKVYYQVAISRYDKIDKNLFNIRGDYNQAKNDKNNILKLTITRTPEFVRNVRVEPEKVEFILKRL